MAKKLKKKANGASKAATNGKAAHVAVAPTGIPSGAVQRARHKEKLPCRVDGDLVELAGKELARCERDRSELKDERRNIMAGFRERLAGIDERAQEHATTIEMGTIARDVWCVDYLLRNGEIMTVREDTSEVVATRAATQDELQEQLPGAKRNGAVVEFPDAPTIEDIKIAGGDLGEPEPPFADEELGERDAPGA